MRTDSTYDWREIGEQVSWYRGARKTTMIVALARKLLIALWCLVTTGEVPDGVELRPAA